MAFLKLLGVTLIAIIGAPVDFALRRPKVLVLVLATVAGWFAYQWTVTAPSPKDTLKKEDFGTLYLTLLGRVERGGPNHLHARRLFYYSEKFAKAEGANVDAVRAGALLHDATKEKGVEDPKERFCGHGENGGELAFTALSTMGVSRDFVVNVHAAIREHMGPLGYSPERGRDRFLARFCSHESYPTPRSREAKVLYDIDMLDLMTVDGVEKVTVMRQKNPEFGKETIKESALSGSDSAWGSVLEAGETLLTSAARACGSELVTHSKTFLDGVNWEAVPTLEAFKQAVTSYKQRSPLPDCLPRVPT